MFHVQVRDHLIMFSSYALRLNARWYIAPVSLCESLKFFSTNREEYVSFAIEILCNDCGHEIESSNIFRIVSPKTKASAEPCNYV